MVERSTFSADLGGFGGLGRTSHGDLPGEMDPQDGLGNLAKVRVASSNLVIRSNVIPGQRPFSGPLTSLSGGVGLLKRSTTPCKSEVRAARLRCFAGAS